MNSPIITLFKGVYTNLPARGHYHVASNGTTRSLYAGSLLLATATAPDHLDFTVHAWINPEHRPYVVEFARQEHSQCKTASVQEIEDAIYYAISRRVVEGGDV